MKNLIALCLAALGLCSCARVDRMITWRGEREIPAGGGTAVWKPVVKDPRIFPTILSVNLGFYDSEDNWVSTTLDMDAEKIKKRDCEKVAGEWFEVVATLNKLTVTLKPNDTPFARYITVGFETGDGKGGDFPTITQPAMPQPQTD